jgi:serine protease Do
MNWIIVSLTLFLFGYSAKFDSKSFRYGIADMVDVASLAVVSIHTEQKVNSALQNNPWFDFFYGPRHGQQYKQRPEQKRQGLGSGVVVNKDGTILTNNHVVEGADKILVQLKDDREFEAEVIGLDKESDVAVIRIKKKVKNLPIMKLGNSDKLRVGEWVVAIGNPFGLSHTVTTGIVSAKEIHGRGITNYENFIQTDAAINPGNSGGALLDLDGKLVGINTAILSRSGGNQGIGFAIPINMAKNIMTDLIAHGEVKRGWLGVSIQDIDAALASALKLKSKEGVLISEIMHNSPASKSKLQDGDLIVSLNGEKIKNTNELRNEVAQLKPGSIAKFIVMRSGISLNIRVVIGNRSGESLPVAFSSTKFGAQVQEEQLEGQNRRIKGLLVKQITPRSIASKNGRRVGDLILKVNGNRVKSLAQYQSNIKSLLKNKKGVLYLSREGRRLFLAIELD